MSKDTPTVPEVATEEVLLNAQFLERSALAILKRKWSANWLRDGAANILYGFLGLLLPSSPQAIVLWHLRFVFKPEQR
jgi:hypothetical protein